MINGRIQCRPLYFEVLSDKAPKRQQTVAESFQVLTPFPRSSDRSPPTDQQIAIGLNGAAVLIKAVHFSTKIHRFARREYKTSRDWENPLRRILQRLNHGCFRRIENHRGQIKSLWIRIPSMELINRCRK